VIVTGVRTQEKHGYTSVQVGCRVPKTGKLKAALLGQFRAEGIAPRADVAEFRVTPDALLPVGTPLTCRHFVPGQRVRVTGTSQGKGFQGAMKRHNFAGMSASHGNSLSHRALGATGCRQDPGKVQKGKKMAGHMGEDTITSDGVVVYKIDVKRNLLYLAGAAPGKPGTLLHIKDSYLHPFRPEAPPPFPTYALTDADRLALAKWAAGAYLAPDEEAYLAQKNALPAGYEREPPFEYIAAPSEVDPFAIPENDDAEEVA
jgi:large subunit ribosomal protein L3